MFKLERVGAMHPEAEHKLQDTRMAAGFPGDLVVFVLGADLRELRGLEGQCWRQAEFLGKDLAGNSHLVVAEARVPALEELIVEIGIQSSVVTPTVGELHAPEDVLR